jgi:hypothetical protein
MDVTIILITNLSKGDLNEKDDIRRNTWYS